MSHKKRNDVARKLAAQTSFTVGSGSSPVPTGFSNSPVGAWTSTDGQGRAFDPLACLVSYRYDPRDGSKDPLGKATVIKVKVVRGRLVREIVDVS